MLAKMPRFSVKEFRNQDNSAEKNKEFTSGLIKDYPEQKNNVFCNKNGTDILDKISG